MPITANVTIKFSIERFDLQIMASKYNRQMYLLCKACNIKIGINQF